MQMIISLEIRSRKTNPTDRSVSDLQSHNRNANLVISPTIYKRKGVKDTGTCTYVLSVSYGTNRAPQDLVQLNV